MLPAGPSILQQLKHGTTFQAESGLGCDVLMEPGGMDPSKTVQTQSSKVPETAPRSWSGSGEDGPLLPLLQLLQEGQRSRKGSF